MRRHEAEPLQTRNSLHLAHECREAASAVGVPLVEGLAAVVNAGTCGGAARAPALRVPRLYYPAAQPLILHLER